MTKQDIINQLDPMFESFKKRLEEYYDDFVIDQDGFDCTPEELLDCHVDIILQRLDEIKEEYLG